MDYVRCLHGAADHLAFYEPDCSAVTDDRNRAWLCYPIVKTQVESFASQEEAPEITAIHNGLVRLGFDLPSTSTCLLYCPNWARLPARLAECP